MLTRGSGDAGPAEGAVVAVPAVVALAETLVALAVPVALVHADLLRAHLACGAGEAVVHAPAPAQCSCCCPGMLDTALVQTGCRNLSMYCMLVRAYISKRIQGPAEVLCGSTSTKTRAFISGHKHRSEMAAESSKKEFDHSFCSGVWLGVRCKLSLNMAA